MAKVVSIVNLKGGVGKTTLTVAIAEFLALGELDGRRRKVLVIDLDPQSNASVALIGEDAWAEQVERKATLFNLFKDKLDDTADFDLTKAIVGRASNLGGGIDNLHVLPSSLEFITIQDRLVNIGQVALEPPAQVLAKALGNTLDGYDLVLVDCPPSLGLVTKNGLFLSDYYLIPVIPDRLSTWGIPAIIREVNSFKTKTAARIMPMGIVISMLRANVSRHLATVAELNARHKTGEWPRPFGAQIPLATKVADATDWGAAGINTLRQKYGWSGSNSFEQLTNVCGEFMHHVFPT